MSARQFRDDDAGYQAWLTHHPDGFVINIARTHTATGARVHHARCRTINGTNPRAGSWTGPYVKVCAQHSAELERWAIKEVGEPLAVCAICNSGPRTLESTPTGRNQRTGPRREYEGRSLVHGPLPGRAVVEAWADAYIQSGDRRVRQKNLSSEIQARCRALKPSDGQVLHTTFFGAKPDGADVENLLLYNIGSFAIAGCNGIRFEHGAVVPAPPDGGEYPFCYRYALAPRSASFTDWRQGRLLASFDWTDLGAFSGEKKLEQVWLALARGPVKVFEPECTPHTPFGVRVRVRPPRGRRPPVWGAGLVKGIFDGVISVFATHADATVLAEVVARLATMLAADAAEIEAHLLDQRRGVLGAVPRLVKLFGAAGVQWSPGDDWCVAGELLAVEPIGSRWEISGELVELSR